MAPYSTPGASKLMKLRGRNNDSESAHTNSLDALAKGRNLPFSKTRLHVGSLKEINNNQGNLIEINKMIKDSE